MSKFIASLAAAIMMVVGLTAGGTATAAPAYPASVDTTTNATVPNKVKRGKKIKVGVKVKAAGTAKPKGTVRIAVFRKVGGKWVKTGKTILVKVRGDKRTVVLPPLKKAGKYKIHVTFKPKKGSVYKKSSTKEKVKVKR